MDLKTKPAANSAGSRKEHHLIMLSEEGAASKMEGTVEGGKVRVLTWKVASKCICNSHSVSVSVPLFQLPHLVHMSKTTLVRCCLNVP
jgi:hypothetical protein